MKYTTKTGKEVNKLSDLIEEDTIINNRGYKSLEVLQKEPLMMLEFSNILELLSRQLDEGKELNLAGRINPNNLNNTFLKYVNDVLLMEAMELTLDNTFTTTGKVSLKNNYGYEDMFTSIQLKLILRKLV